MSKILGEFTVLYPVKDDTQYVCMYIQYIQYIQKLTN